jgi:hypothetical protein
MPYPQAEDKAPGATLPTPLLFVPPTMKKTLMEEFDFDNSDTLNRRMVTQ